MYECLCSQLIPPLTMHFYFGLQLNRDYSVYTLLPFTLQMNKYDGGDDDTGRHLTIGNDLKLFFYISLSLSLSISISFSLFFLSIVPHVLHSLLLIVMTNSLIALTQKLSTETRSTLTGAASSNGHD